MSEITLPRATVEAMAAFIRMINAPTNDNLIPSAGRGQSPDTSD